MVHAGVDVSAACHTVLVEYHRAIDTGRATAALEHFAEDAVFEARGHRFTGREEIRGFLTEREAMTDRASVHVVANVRTVSGATPDEPALSALVLLHARRPDGSYALERVLDTVHRFRRCGDCWCITSRESSPLHASDPLVGHAPRASA